MKMVQWDEREVEQQNKDQCTSKATLMMLDHKNNQMIQIDGSPPVTGQDGVATQAPTPSPAVRRGPYVPPPLPNQQQANQQQASQICTHQQPIKLKEDQVREAVASKVSSKQHIMDMMGAQVRRAVMGNWRKTAIGLAAYLFLIGGAVGGAMIGSDHFFKFLSEKMHVMGSDMHDKQSPQRLKTARLS